MSETVLDSIIARLEGALANDANAQVGPIALLWPDEAAQWTAVVGRIGERLPLVSLGDYDASMRCGPAYWIRCVVARTIDIGLPEGRPIVYLPGVSRRALRAADSCPSDLAPIAELQYRSQWFSHPNNRDWTVRAFLSNKERGLGLSVPEDAQTVEALLLSIDRLVDERLERVDHQVLDADYLLELVNEDPVRSVLKWLDNPQNFKAGCDEARWDVFVRQCRSDYGFDPNVDGEVTAAHKLGTRAHGWPIVWRRFTDTPELYPGLVDQLRKARPEELVPDHPDAWPQDNEAAEDQLRRRLREFDSLTAGEARAEVVQLDKDHAPRRRTVWADLDLATVAFALEQLVALSELTAHPHAEGSLDAQVADYARHGWRADDAVLRALAAVADGEDRDAVSAAAAALYRPWLESVARAFQAAVGPLVNAHHYQASPPAPVTAGTVTVFVDGLRLDVSRRVQEQLTGVGLNVSDSTGLSAVPTVTQTAKSAIMPVPGGKLGPGPELHAANVATGTKASIGVLRTLMGENGVQILGPTDTGDPSGAAWAEAGELDHHGHDLGIRLVDRLEEEVGRIVHCVRALLQAGWQRVEIVTDHGWILLPGGMEKIELPVATTVVKKGRCARLKEGATVEVPTVPWFWDPNVRIAVAPGAGCFEANKEYEHGGVSPQECVVPRLSVTAGAAAISGGPELTQVRWRGLQCRVEFAGVTDQVLVDIRRRPADPESSIAEKAKETSTPGKVSLLVPDEEQEGERAHLVLEAPDGQILAQRQVVVGSNT